MRNEKGQFVKGFKYPKKWGEKRTRPKGLKYKIKNENKGWFKKGYIPKHKGKELSEKHKISLSISHKGQHNSLKTEFKKGQKSWNKNMEHKKIQGKGHWNWQGGKTPEIQRIYHSLEYKIWRRKVFERDNYTCQDCGIKSGCGKKVYLEAHHKKERCNYPELIFDVDNGLTLCEDCHNLTKKGGRTLCVV